MRLRVDHISKAYDKNVVLNQVSFELGTGVYGLLGANGSGKTTLLRIICGLLPADHGQVLFNNENILDKAEVFRSSLGFLPQEFSYYPDFTGEKFLLYISALKGLNRQLAMKRSLELLDLVGLIEVRKKKIRHYSGGMRQRLGIAQALINDPRILILDEPTVGLDPKERVKFRKLLNQISADKIVLLSTHIVSDVESIADDILILKNGNIQNRGSAQTLLSEIENQVWECLVSEEEARQLERDALVSNRRYDSQGLVLRIISSKQPNLNAKQVVANLEDLYLYYFREE